MFSVKQLFIDYLTQLNVIVDKVPDALFSKSLTENMFTLELNAQIAANFLSRGYSPMVGETARAFELDGSGKAAVKQVLVDVNTYLTALPDVHGFNDDICHTDTAGFANINLVQSRFVLNYIIPNFMFHMSMVYAIARSNNIALSKGDFDDLHDYPADFSFVNTSE